MRVILSRKGFDAEFGGLPSPILPDGTLASLPIPDPGDSRRFSEVFSGGRRASTVLAQLWGRRQGRPPTRCHLDPDLDPRAVRTRPLGWLPAFGQHGAAGAHLDGQGVGVGDLFLFFGWFRQTEWVGRRLRYRPGAPDLHVVFGYLQVGEVVRLGPEDPVPEALGDHPHAQPALRRSPGNRVYRAVPQLDDGGPGGAFLGFRPDRVLTAKGHPRSRWRLPDALREVPITYHRSDAWRSDHFQSARKGQEFVLGRHPAASAWALGLLGPDPTPGR